MRTLFKLSIIFLVLFLFPACETHSKDGSKELEKKIIQKKANEFNKKHGKRYSGPTFFQYREKDKVGLKNSNAEIVIPAIYKNVSITGHDKIRVWDSENKVGLVDTFHNQIFPIEYQEIIRMHFDEKEANQEIWIVKKNDLWGTMDNKGNILIPLEYQKLRRLKKPHNFARKNDKSGIIDNNNNIIIPFEYDILSYTDIIINGELLLEAGTTNNVGFINEKQEVIIPKEYDRISRFMPNSEKFFKVQKNNHEGLISNKNEIIVPIKYKRIAFAGEEMILFTDDNQQIRQKIPK